jgi:23S rRNA pseudouridine2605 synthase
VTEETDHAEVLEEIETGIRAEILMRGEELPAEKEMNESRIDRFQENGDETLEKQRAYVQEYTPKPRQPKAAGEEGTRLNKFIANSGICSRREADDFITAGVVSVNDQVVTELRNQSLSK